MPCTLSTEESCAWDSGSPISVLRSSWGQILRGTLAPRFKMPWRSATATEMGAALCCFAIGRTSTVPSRCRYGASRSDLSLRTTTLAVSKPGSSSCVFLPAVAVFVHSCTFLPAVSLASSCSSPAVTLFTQSYVFYPPPHPSLAISLSITRS
jgi:hypothetical protein